VDRYEYDLTTLSPATSAGSKRNAIFMGRLKFRFASIAGERVFTVYGPLSTIKRERHFVRRANAFTTASTAMESTTAASQQNSDQVPVHGPFLPDTGKSPSRAWLQELSDDQNVC